jgi:phospholipid/cholesterol/gamma-HCH transport system substrate-binding protein
VQRVERSTEAFDQMTRQIGAAGASATVTLDASRADLKQFTGETLPEVRELVGELRTLTAALQRTVDNVERDPGSLVFGRARPRPGPGE